MNLDSVAGQVRSEDCHKTIQKAWSSYYNQITILRGKSLMREKNILENCPIQSTSLPDSLRETEGWFRDIKND
jgi:hypothetical protein